MGTNVSKSVSKITQDISNKLNQESTASSSADCGIKTGNIILKNAERCTVRNQNFCGVTAGAVIDTAVESAASAFNSATAEQKAAVLPGMNINSSYQDIETAIKNELEQKCSSNSDLRNQIVTSDIIIEGCKDSEIININTGDATTTCGVRAIMQTATTAQNVASATQETTGLNLFGSTGTVIIVIIVIIIVGVILFVGYKFLFGGWGQKAFSMTPAGMALSATGMSPLKSVPTSGVIPKLPTRISLPSRVPPPLPPRMFGGRKFHFP
jgi:hypothetical protein